MDPVVVVVDCMDPIWILSRSCLLVSQFSSEMTPVFIAPTSCMITGNL